MAGTFEFIDNSSIKGKSRKIIRSHVMKGKNAGKARPRRRALPPSTSTSVEVARTDELPRPGPKISLHLLSRICADISNVSFPSQLSPQSGILLRQFMRYMGEALYPPEFCFQVDAIRSIWFQYMLEDEAYFHCLLALASACLAFASGVNTNSWRNSYHFTRGLHLVNHKLSGADALSDTALAGVMTLCTLASVQEDPTDLEIHFSGLCRMIELRGGLEQLEYNFALMEKSHRIDFELAVQRGSPTRFVRKNRSIAEIVSPRLTFAEEEDWMVRNALRNVYPEVAIAGRELMHLKAALQSGTMMEKLDHVTFEELNTSVCYRLITINPLAAPRLADPLTDAIHVGFIVFMTTMLAQFGTDCRMVYPLLTQRYKMALEDPRFIRAVDPTTHLWLLVVGGIAVFRGDNRTWLLPQIAATASQLGVRDWKGASTLIHMYPWINILHDRPGMKLWDSGVDRYLPNALDLNNTSGVVD